jgi:iron complex outermembrane receptor protein
MTGILATMVKLVDLQCVDRNMQKFAGFGFRMGDIPQSADTDPRFADSMTIRSRCGQANTPPILSGSTPAKRHEEGSSMKASSGRGRWLRAGASCLALLWMSAATAAIAQDNPAEPPAGGPRAAETAAPDDSGDIVITARRRDETLLETPLAVSALGEQQLREQSLVSVADLNRAAPNVVLRQTNSGGGTIDAVIRGQSIPLSNVAIDPSVGFYFDDVVVVQGKGIAAALFDIRSIEIARGVQGTLRGRNNTGGSISINSRRPELGQWGVEAGAAYGSRDYLQLQGIANVPVTDTLALRFGAQRITQDGVGRSIFTGQELGGRDQWTARASLLFEPSPDVTIYAVYDHVTIDQQPLARRVIPGSLVYDALINGTRNANNASGLQLTPDQIIPEDFWDSSTNPVIGNDFANVDFWRGSISYRISDAATVRVIGGYRDMIALGGLDLDGSPALNNDSLNGGDSTQFTVEPQIFGDLTSNLSYILGYYHFNDRGTLIADTRPWVVNTANPTQPFHNRLVIREGARNVSDAVYGHLEYNPIPRLELAAGARYTWDDRRIFPNRVQQHSEPEGSTFPLFQAGTIQAVGCQFTTAVNGVQRPAGGFVLVNGTAIASGACPDVTLRRTFSYFSYELSARYELTDNLAVYARHGLGQKAGGINIPVTSIDSPVEFAPEEVRDYEIGLKGDDLFGGRFDFSLALYYSDYDDLQRNIGTLLPGTTTTATATVNAGSARVQGIEADFRLRATDRLTISGFLGYTDAKYREFVTLGANGVPIDLTDQPFYATPEFTSRIGAVYAVPLGSGTLRIGGGWNHQSNTSFQAIFFEGAESGVVDLVDARISWTSDDDQWELAAYGTNLLNDKYLTSAQANRTGISTSTASVATAYGTQGEPRFFGVRATWRWGQPAN